MTAAVCSGAAAAELSLRSVTVTQRTAAKRLRTGSAGRDALKKNLFLFWGFFFSPHQKMPFQEWKVIPQNSAGRGCATCLQPPAFSQPPPWPGPSWGPPTAHKLQRRDMEWPPELLPTRTHCALHTLTQPQLPEPKVCASPLLTRITCREQGGTAQQRENGAVQLGLTLWEQHQ